MQLALSTSGREPLEVATRAAFEAGKILTDHFRSEKRISYKEGKSNIVTDVDILAEEKIIGFLRTEFPDFGFIAEESASIAGNTSYTWVIDPLDGTRNYAHGVPHFCVSIALGQGEDILLGVIHDPVRGETFSVLKEGGAFLNGSPVSVSNKGSLEACLVGFDMGYNAERGRQMLEVAGTLWPGVEAVRVMGSAALGLAYIACGRLDLYINLSLSAWDLAAGVLLVRQGGGVVTDYDGRSASLRSNNIVAASPRVHADFMGRRKQTH